jgi:hypothetical protein
MPPHPPPSPGRPQLGLSRERSRSTSVKRKSSNDLSYAEVMSQPQNSVPPAITPEIISKTEALNVNIAKASSLCEKVQSDICETNCDPTIISAFTSICDAMKLINANQSSIAEILSAVTTVPAAVPSRDNPVSSEPSFVSLGAISKKIRPDANRTIPTLLPPGPQREQFVPASKTQTVKTEVEKFKDAVREAEKSTVLFNLNMGNFPLLNTTTISKKATAALTAMAAKVEKRSDNHPSQEAINAIDDLLSVTKNMTFFGNATKPYNNPLDPDSGKFYTIPVKYEFKDRDTRSKVEQILRALRC